MLMLLSSAGFAEEESAVVGVFMLCKKTEVRTGNG